MKRAAGAQVDDMLAGRSLHTVFPDLHLRLLTAADAPALYRLVSENAEHLTRHGNYRELLAMSYQAIETELSGDDGGHMRFGIFLKEALIGRVDLIGVEPPKFSIGYWLSENATGQGYASESLRTLIDFARICLGISDLYAGVTHGNGPSEALLRRVGFEPDTTFASHTRFHLGLSLI